MSHDALARLTNMRETAPYAASAEEILRGLSVFLNEDLGWPAILLVIPTSLSIEEQNQALKTLYEWKFLHASSEHTIRIDPQMIDALQPSPSDDERHFAIHAARILRKRDTSISKKTFDLYFNLMDWAMRHKPEIGFSLGECIAPKYGGPGLRFYERLYQEAKHLNLVDQQAKIMFKLGQRAARQKRPDLAAEKYRQVLTLGDPITAPHVAYLHIYALEYLGHFARNEAKWAQARTFYERAMHLRERAMPDRPITLDLLLWLCRVTEKQGDTVAHRHYGDRVRANPSPYVGGMPIALQRPVGMTDPDQQRERYALMEQMPWMSRHILWHWGQFEYEQGNHKTGYALCKMGLLNMEAHLDHGTWRFTVDVHYNDRKELEWQYLEELRQGLRDMNWDGKEI